MEEVNSSVSLGNGSLAAPGVDEDSPPCGVFFFVVYGPLFGLVCLLGLIGNSLSFAVLHKYSRNNVATFLLKALAVSDNLFLAVAALANFYPAMCIYFSLAHFEPLYPYFQTYVWPLTHMTQMGTVYMMLLVAANRYIAVCRPLQAPRLATKRQVHFQLSVMTVAIIVYNIPRFFEHNWVNVNTTLADNSTSTMNENSGLAGNPIYNIAYENVSYCLFVFLLPLLVLIVFNVHLVRELKKAQRCRLAMTSRSSMEENNITLVMIIIIIVFIVCQTPATLNQILFYLIGTGAPTVCTHYLQYSHISNLLITTNSSLNFVIYCLFRRQFQQELIALLCHGKKGSRPLRRTIVLRALHGEDDESRSSSRRHRGRPPDLRRSTNSAPKPTASGASSPGGQSQETNSSHLSNNNHCNSTPRRPPVRHL